MRGARGQREHSEPNGLIITTDSSSALSDVDYNNREISGLVPRPRGRTPNGHKGPLHEDTASGNRSAHDILPRRYRGKRFFDLALFAAIAIPALIIGIMSAIAILLDDGAPVLFRQVRTGRDGQPFVLLKLRTMSKGKQRDGAFPEEHEITRIGRILRRISIDEVPQLINVLRGEMSIVGPRPTLPYQVQRYDSRQRGRLHVQPGLTGLAQVNGRNQMTWSERIEWDLQYIENQSFRLDLKVLSRTVGVILTGDGVSGHPHHDPLARTE